VGVAGRIRGSFAAGASSGLVLVVALTVALAEMLRVSFPLLYGLAEDIGFLVAAAVVPALFALPLLAVPLAAFVGVRRVVAATGMLVGIARVVAQVQATPGLAVAMVAVVVGLVALPLALRVVGARRGPVTAVSALFVGLALDAGIRLAFATWDAAWQAGVVPLLTGVLVATGVVLATGRLVGWWQPGARGTAVGVPLDRAAVGPAGIAAAPPGGGTRPADVPASWGLDSVRTGLVVGPVLALQTLVFASPGFVGSSAGVGLGAAGAVVVVGLLLAAAGLVGPIGTRRRVAWAAAAVVVVVPLVATGPTAVGGPVVVVLVWAGQWATGVLVVQALARTAGMAVPDVGHAPGLAPAWRSCLGAGLGSLVLVAGMLPYQISYELPLGVPQVVWPTLVALVLVGVATVGRTRALLTSGGDVSPEVGPGGHRAGLGAIGAVLVVPLVLALTAPSPGAPDAVDRAVPAIRVATYNLHSGVGGDGRLDPERIAAVLEDGGAEVMALQEVARGWPLAGGLDVGAWLSRRLGADMAYGPAADRQFGNAVLATRPIQRWRAGTMPRGEGTMQRGWVAATVSTGDQTLEVFSVHLQHQDHTTATRRAQARQVLEAWAGQARSVVAGDLNSRPGSLDIEPWFDDTGLVSAQESWGGVVRDTSPAHDPDHRIDWILGTPDLVFSEVSVPATTASDHLPVFTTVRATDG
jgi:endonuclease/exonuclease/phosphatase family metal-dependent hydrolase